MRFTLAVDGLEANWIEFKDFWTRREGKELYELGEAEAFNKFVACKCLACHLEDTAGQVIDEPAKLTYDALDDADARVFGFVVRSLYQSYREQVNLGNASARASSNGVVPVMKTAPTNLMN